MAGVGANQSLSAAKYFNQVVDATKAQTILGSCQAKGFTPTPDDFGGFDAPGVGSSQSAMATQFATKHGCMPPSDQIHDALQQAVGPGTDTYKYLQQAGLTTPQQ